jgi:phosphoribosylformylglycinamidine synthase
MTDFKDRERGEEAKFAHDETMAFRIAARRNRLLGQWAAQKMGLTPEETEAYAKEVVQADFEEGGDEDVIRKVLGDLTSAGWLGASLYLREIIGREDGAPPPVDLATERRHGDFVLRLGGEGRILACHDLSDGGLAVAQAEMCIASRMGAGLAVPHDVPSVMGWLFGEEQGRYLLAVRADDHRRILEQAAEAGVIAREVGTTGGDALILTGEAPISVETMAEQQAAWLPRYMAGQD